MIFLGIVIHQVKMTCQVENVLFKYCYFNRDHHIFIVYECHNKYTIYANRMQNIAQTQYGFEHNMKYVRMSLNKNMLCSLYYQETHLCDHTNISKATLGEMAERE